MLEYFQADEELEVWIFLDLLDQFFIREPRRVLMIKAPSAMRKGFAGAPKPLQNCAA